MYGGDSSDKEIYFGGARPKVSMDTRLGLSTTVLSASTPKMVETQQEIRRLTKSIIPLNRKLQILSVILFRQGKRLHMFLVRHKMYKGKN